MSLLKQYPTICFNILKLSGHLFGRLILFYYLCTMSERMSKRLLAFRKLAGLSQKRLSELSGVNVASINHIEHGGNFNRDTILKLEKALNVNLY